MKTISSLYRNFLIFLLISIAGGSPERMYGMCCGEAVAEFGWFTAHQGKSQHIGIDGLIGDDFSVTKSSDQNFLLGLGYYFKGLDCSCVSLLYGVNAFYLAPTQVKGKVTQEDLYTNLSYRYSRTNYPIYFSAKSLIHFSECSAITVDLGIGPNIILTHGFKEHSLDGGISLSDGEIFSGKTSVAFSAMAGIGWRFNILNGLSLELDYRFFYLGEGKFKRNNSQLKNTLRTGNSYANALFFSISF